MWWARFGVVGSEHWIVSEISKNHEHNMEGIQNRPNIRSNNVAGENTIFMENSQVLKLVDGHKIRKDYVKKMWLIMTASRCN